MIDRKGMKIIVDNNYKVKPEQEGFGYNEEFFELIEDIEIAKRAGNISEEAARALISIVIRKEMTHELSDFLLWLERSSRKKELCTLFIRLLSKNKKYAK